MALAFPWRISLRRPSKNRGSGFGVRGSQKKTGFGIRGSGFAERTGLEGFPPPNPSPEPRTPALLRTPNPKSRTPTTYFEPNIYLYDKYPGGIGFSEPLFRLSETLLGNTQKLIANCPCEAGCPSCVGPAGDLAPRAKEAALAILERVCADTAAAASMRPEGAQ